MFSTPIILVLTKANKEMIWEMNNLMEYRGIKQNLKQNTEFR